jgi:tetratricopeptide (TPR) repeat protein
MRCREAVALTLLLSLAGPLAARSPQDPRRDFAAWMESIQSHTPGERDAAVSRIAQWTRGDLEPLLGRLSGLPDAFAVTRRALLLHVDIAILHRRPTNYDLPSGDTTMTLFEDGTAVGQARGTIHWDIGRRLIDRLPAIEERDQIARTYYRAVAAILQSWNEDPELTAHFAAARRVLPNDAPMLLYEGTQRQMYAGARAQLFFAERRETNGRYQPTANMAGRPPVSESVPPPALPAASSSRAQAEQFFRRALRVEPTLVEARLRLAHVLGDQGRVREATAELAKAAEVTDLPPLLAYYRAVLTGRMARARGDLDAADTAFQHASTIYAGAHVPHIALSEIASARGDRARSLQALEAAARLPADQGDPWWAIDRVHAPTAEMLLDEMRRAFLP